MKNILIVDDQNTIRSMLKDEISKIKNVAVIEAVNGNEALGKAKVAKPALILLDIEMPRKNGLETLKELKEFPRTKDIPVIIISAHLNEDNKNKATELGAEKYIDKENIKEINFVDLVKKYL